MKGQLRIESMFAFIQMDTDNTEGVIAMLDVSSGTWIPLVGADMDKVKQLRPVAQRTALTTGRPVHLIHFTNREEIEVIEP